MQLTESMEQITAPPIVLTIAGSDSSGGAGIQADIKTFSAFRVYGASVVTAVTAQNTRGVVGIHKIPADMIAAQFDAVGRDLGLAAIKTGMLVDLEVVRAVATLLAGVRRVPVVVDPVMIATSGDALLEDDAIDAVRTLLLPIADVATPNLAEAARLLDVPIARDDEEAARHARDLLQFGMKAVLLKGGHGWGAYAVDWLATRDNTIAFTKPRIATRNSHGTGCTLSAAIASGLAKGNSLEQSVRNAKAFVFDALVSARDMKIGSGAGPVDHLVRNV